MVHGAYFHQLYFLLGVLFLLGAQATFFGPVKYSILPQHLAPSELVAGNGLVETGTFIAILLGTMTGGLLISLQDGWAWVALLLLLIAVSGWVASFKIPGACSFSSELTIHWNIFTETWRNIKFSQENKSVFFSVLSNSWFWFYGSVFLAQLPSYTKYFLSGNENVVTLLLILFSIGIGIGSLLCDRLSKHKVEMGLVPFGSIGLSLFAVTLYFFSPSPHTEALLSFSTFLNIKLNWLILLNIVVLGMFGGFYIVPLYAIIQARSEPAHRSRIIAANNILNALFMVMAAIFSILALKSDITVTQLFLLTGILNAVFAVYVYHLEPEFVNRFLIWCKIIKNV